jgi:hypothetical protein
MPTDQENCDTWFVRPLESLYPKEEFGFIIVMATFPLLARHLRQKVNLPPGKKPDKAFYAALKGLFPELGDKAQAFWWKCRNGLLHYGTFNSHGVFIVHGQNEPVVVEDAPTTIFRLEPVVFARKVFSNHCRRLQGLRQPVVAAIADD